MVSKSCKYAKGISEGHNWEWFHRVKEYRCVNSPCPATKKGNPPKHDGFQGKGRIQKTTIPVRGSWGNKNDKAMAEQRHLKPGQSGYGKDSAKGCAVAGIGLLGGAITALYALIEGVSNLIA